MLLKLNDNKKTLVFAIACFFLAMLLNLIQLKNIYADGLIEDNPFDKFDVSNVPDGYEYIGYNNSNNIPCLFVTSGVVALKKENNGCIVSGDYINYSIYTYNNNSWNLSLQSSTTSQYQTVNIDIYKDNIKYSSYDLNYISSDKVVFLKAPLGIIPVGPTIQGGLKAKTITELALNWTEYLIPLVLGLVVLAIAFRKGWTMLKTVLVGA